MPDFKPSRLLFQSARTVTMWVLLVGGIDGGLIRAESPSDARLTPIVLAVQQAGPSVVNIQGQKSVHDTRSTSGARQVNGMGTGVVIDPRGYILTNYHVVDGVSRINVTLKTGQTYVATIVAHDSETDLAVIRIHVTKPLTVIHIGTSHDLMTGETVIAVGNAFGYENTVTQGIISALHRNVQVNETQQYLDLIQTDASINPGNSGGPLLNIDGEMIGVNVAVRAGAQGIGFAIPVDKALQIGADILSIERIDKHWHGMTTALLNGSRGPVTVTRIVSDSPAAMGGLKRGDRIERIGRLAIDRPIDVERALLGRSIGEEVPLVVRRENEIVELDLKIASLAKSPPKPYVVKSQPPSAERSTPQPGNALEKATWESFGMILVPEERSHFVDRGLSFSGGMRVVAVRRGSSAAQEGIRKGDLLVKMHRWTTVSEQDIRYLVKRADSIAKLGSVRFYIVRGNDTYFGQMKIAVRMPSSRR
jgi:S1-C subfamily serine protease